MELGERKRLLPASLEGDGREENSQYCLWRLCSQRPRGGPHGRPAGLSTRVAARRSPCVSVKMGRSAVWAVRAVLLLCCPPFLPATLF